MRTEKKIRTELRYKKVLRATNKRSLNVPYQAFREGWIAALEWVLKE